MSDMDMQKLNEIGTQIARELEDVLEEKIVERGGSGANGMLVGMIAARVLYGAWQNVFDMVALSGVEVSYGKEDSKGADKPDLGGPWSKDPGTTGN